MNGPDLTTLIACYRSGQITEAQWQQHLSDTPGLKEAWSSEQRGGGAVTSEREPDFIETLQSAASFCESLKRTGEADAWDFDYLIGKLRDAAFVVDMQQKRLKTIDPNYVTSPAALGKPLEIAPAHVFFARRVGLRWQVWAQTHPADENGARREWAALPTLFWREKSASEVALSMWTAFNDGSWVAQMRHAATLTQEAGDER